MGYTHYWTFKPVKRGQTKQVNAAYKAAITDCNKVISFWQSMANDEDRLSGYSAHEAPGTYLGVNFNGKQELAHEDFVLRDFYKNNGQGGFCKTAQKPYDTVVTACLAILKHHLRDQIVVDSDGRPKDFNKGLGLVIAALNYRPANPLGREQLGVAI